MLFITFLTRPPWRSKSKAPLLVRSNGSRSDIFAFATFKDEFLGHGRGNATSQDARAVSYLIGLAFGGRSCYFINHIIP